MRDDPKIKALRRKFGHTGYSVWNMLLESITDSDNFRFSIDYEITAGDYDVDPDTLREIILYCVKMDLLQTNTNDTIIWSKTLDNRMQPLLSKRKRNRNPTDDELSTSENPQSKVKESKGFIAIGEPKEKYLIVLTRLAGQKPKKIYDLQKHFEGTGQLDGLKFKGSVYFDAFMDQHTAKIFNDEMHLDNTFRNFSEKYVPPVRAPNRFQKAEENKSLWTTVAWEDFYRNQLNTNPEFRKHFGYAELSSSAPVGS
jgi:hypothetical protein